MMHRINNNSMYTEWNSLMTGVMMKMKRKRNKKQLKKLLLDIRMHLKGKELAYKQSLMEWYQ